MSCIVSNLSEKHLRFSRELEKYKNNTDLQNKIETERKVGIV